MNKHGFLTSELAVILASALVAMAIYWPVQKRMAAAAQSAEAQMHLSQISTLEKAYYTEYGHYVGFSEYYGAPMQGEDHCRRPDGAGELGFKLRWCHDKDRGDALLYAYMVELTPAAANGDAGFHAYAVSGSDAKGNNLVCQGAASVERWQVGRDKKVVKTNACL